MTCTGWRGESVGLRRCGTLRSFFGSPLPCGRFPFLRPPQVGKCSCSCFGFPFAALIFALPAAPARLARGEILTRGLTLFAEPPNVFGVVMGPTMMLHWPRTAGMSVEWFAAWGAGQTW